MEIIFRPASIDDLPEIIKMLSDDHLGSGRESYEIPLAAAYYRAFQKIRDNADQELTVLECDLEIIGTFHLSFLQYLTYQGGLRAQVEAVRVKKEFRHKGIGKRMFEYIIKRSKEKGCHLIQLTTDLERPDALKFYESLGFRPSHTGLKLKL